MVKYNKLVFSLRLPGHQIARVRVSVNVAFLVNHFHYHLREQLPKSLGIDG
jgi:hypothetical protein